MLNEVWGIISSFLVFVFGLIIIVRFARKFSVPDIRSLILYSWHTIFCLAYFFYVGLYGGDSNSYYLAALEGNVEFTFGTAAIKSFATLLVHGFGLSKLGCFLFFNIFGSIGLLAFDSALRQATENKSKYLKLLATIIVFLPSVSFWSSGLGKDSVSFLATGLALWAALQLNNRMKLMIVAIVLMLLVRPHMAGMMVIALALSVSFDKNVNIKTRLFLSILSIVGVVILVPFALNYAGVSDYTSANSVNEYIEKRQSHNMDGGGGVNLSSMGLPMKLFTYMFRPLIFEVNSITSFAAAIDNTILLFLFIISGISHIRKKRKSYSENRTFMWIYALIAWLVLASTTANLGISLRQKWMFAPMVIYLFVSLIGKDKKLIPLSNQSLKPRTLNK